MNETNATPTVRVRGEAAFVALKPSLACLLNPAGDTQVVQAFVHAIALDRLRIERVGPGATKPIPAPYELRLSLRSDLHYTIVVDSLVGVERSEADPNATLLEEALVSAPASRAALADLLNVLRKSQHITICETQDVEASDRYTGFTDLVLLPRALPELAWKELDTSREFLGRRFTYPILITGMTGGLRRGAEINLRLARAAAQFDIPMGVGSQRIALENPDHAAIFAVKRQVPGVFLIGNLGAAQLIGRSKAAALEWCKRAVEQIEADALALHVNVLQEVIQVEGDRDFRGLLERIEHVCRHLPVPVVVKEVGCGIDLETARCLVESGVRAIDVGGKGGTSWSLIEGERAASGVTQTVGRTFRDWGIPTACAALALRKKFPDLELVATGGIRDGLTVAKAAALGCRMAGIGLPLLRAALASEDAPFDLLETLTRELKTAMIASGSAHLGDMTQHLRANGRFQEMMRLYDQDGRDGVIC